MKKIPQRQDKPLISRNDKNYLAFLETVKSRIRDARIRAARSASRELIDLYWYIGEDIVDRQERLGWGKAVVEKLSKDLKADFSGTRGFSSANLWRMRQFYMEYRGHTNLAQLAREIPWFSNVAIFSKIKESDAREYYLQATAKMGWGRNVLIHQIKMGAYERHLKSRKQHTFKESLPQALAEQADQTMKDIYMLDFLGITKSVIERKVEEKMVEAIKDVLLELGYGFSFMGNQYKVKLENKEYFIDLLFYHRKLRSLVAIEIKTGSFQPEHAGKMNFHLNLLDDFVREEGENPSIGIIFCAERDRIEVEYALRGINKPVGVSEYRLTHDVPKELADKLPDVKKLEKEVLRELKSGKIDEA